MLQNEVNSLILTFWIYIAGNLYFPTRLFLAFLCSQVVKRVKNTKKQTNKQNKTKQKQDKNKNKTKLVSPSENRTRTIRSANMQYVRCATLIPTAVQVLILVLMFFFLI